MGEAVPEPGVAIGIEVGTGGVIGIIPATIPALGIMPGAEETAGIIEAIDVMGAIPIMPGWPMPIIPCVWGIIPMPILPGWPMPIMPWGAMDVCGIIPIPIGPTKKF